LADVIQHVIWLFLRFALSCHELEELLAGVHPGAPRDHLVLSPFQSRDYTPVASSAFEASGLCLRSSPR
jgi:hypothetical protein